MAMMMLPADVQKRLIGRRRRLGIDRFDEVWDGVYVMSPEADNEHGEVSGLIYGAILPALSGKRARIPVGGVNITDRTEGWKKNYRSPDVAVFLPGNPAIDKKSHWLGGPDFAVEVVSRYDQSRKKFDFYAKVGTRELLIVDRFPWSVELYRLIDGTLQLVGKSSLDQPATLTSEVLPLSFALIPGEDRPEIEVIHTQDARRWLA